MNVKTGFVFLCLFLCLSVFSGASGQSQVGVKVGDTFTYRCTLLGTHNTSLSWDLWVPDRNGSRWEVTVTNIEGTRVTFQLQILLANSTEELFPSQWVDVYSGGSNGPNYMFFVAPNLSTGTQVYPGGANYFVNDTLTKDYASGARITNHVNFASPLDYRDSYNDKATGVLVEFKATYLDLFGSVNLKLVNSSLWIVSTSPTTSPTTSVQTSPPIPEFPSAAILLISTAVGLGVVALHRTQKPRKLC